METKSWREVCSLRVQDAKFLLGVRVAVDELLGIAEVGFEDVGADFGDCGGWVGGCGFGC